MNLDPDTAAKKIRVKSERLLKCEAGEALLTVNQLRKAARLYRRPLATFFLPEPPRDFHVPHDYRQVPGAPPKPLSPEFIAAVREAEYRRDVATQFADEIPEDPRRFIGSVSLNAEADSVARKIRRMLGLSLQTQKLWNTNYDALNAWKEAIEEQGVLVFHFSSVDVQEVRAFSINQTVFPIIAVNGADSPTGRVFSLLHEFTHLLLDREGACNFREHERGQFEERTVEVFCNYSAGATLVPAGSLLAHPLVRRAGKGSTWTDEQLAHLADLYHVSRQVVLRRLLIVGKTNRRFYRLKRQDLAEAGAEKRAGGFLTWPQRVVRGLGRPFLRIILEAYYREAMTSSDLAEVIGVRLKHLPAIEERLAGPNVLTGSDR
ncbi:MAG: ImmA/IrrE family metallo-endopeptidase [Planctomycetota bacterium]